MQQKIKGVINEKPHRVYCLSLSEKQFLFRKYIAEGCLHQEAKQKIFDLNEKIKDMAKKLRKKNKSETEINNLVAEQMQRFLEGLR